MRTAALLGLVVAAVCASAAFATDEIQVYDASVNAPGQFSLQLHGNYAAQSRKTPDFPGGFAADGAFNGTPEFAYGLRDWWEIGAYVPYAVTSDGTFKWGGVKLRTLFVSPHAGERDFFYGMNFEFSYTRPRFDPNRFNMEARPIIGVRSGPVDFIVNPILDIALSGSVHTPTFVPAVRLAYNLSKQWAVAVEHYMDFGPIDRFAPPAEQLHDGFIVVDYSGEKFGVDFGIGHGFTAASDKLIFKFILNFGF